MNSSKNFSPKPKNIPIIHFDRRQLGFSGKIIYAYNIKTFYPARSLKHWHYAAIIAQKIDPLNGWDVESRGVLRICIESVTDCLKQRTCYLVRWILRFLTII